MPEAENALRAERLQTLGQLTGGVAHDFNNLLSVVMLNLEETILELPHDHPTQAWLGAALLATTRGAELTSRLLAYGRRPRLKPQRIDLREIFGELSALLNRTLGEQFVLTLDRVWLRFGAARSPTMEACVPGGVLLPPCHTSPA